MGVRRKLRRDKVGQFQVWRYGDAASGKGEKTGDNSRESTRIFDKWRRGLTKRLFDEDIG